MGGDRMVLTFKDEEDRESMFNEGKNYAGKSAGSRMVIKCSSPLKLWTKLTKVVEIENKGLESVRLSGEDKNIMVLTGDGIDAVELTMLLRKNLGSFELLSVGPVEYGGEPLVKKLPLKAIFTENV
ncbi:hypothetical protein Vadar_015261 [Vaccinium darrowii]|uniref:Uncharacterized protein n=1 Tax=Vaccinium darrowii TaxID=229202 RepID=A0ACB7YFU2_9ERIC|nr:hypothetical protein Vadar_015261 [Vaccinium darrowii]